MAPIDDVLRPAAAQHVDHVTHAETLPRARDRRQDLLGDDVCAFDRFEFVQAHVARAAIGVRILLPEVATEHRVPTRGAIGEPLHLGEQRQLRVEHVLRRARLPGGTFHDLAPLRRIGSGVEQQALGR